MENLVMNRPTEMLADLGMFEKITDVPKLNERIVEEFEQRKRAFDWVHMGTADLPLHKLIEVIRSNPLLSVPRSGHIGNWEDIALGRAGMLDYNKAICAERELGYPLIYDFNQTETTNMQDGDWIYLPGSIVQKGLRVELPLFSWDGSDFVERSREHALCTPFVLTPVDGQLVPLLSLHRRRMQHLNGLDFQYEARVIRGSEQLVRDILHFLIDYSRAQSQPQRLFEEILDRAASLDGRVYRGLIRMEGEGYLVGETYYENTSRLVDAAMLPFIAADEPDAFFAAIKSFPPHLPLVSNLIINLLYAVLNTHYRGVEIDRSKMTRPFNPHFHWGALGMAGYPPKKRGYFREKIGIVKEFYKALVDNFSQIDPVFYILLPASTFTLLPSSAYPQDVPLVEDLIGRIHESTAPLLGKPNLMLVEIDRTVAKWWDETRDALSPYFVNRFSSRRSVLNAGELPDHSVSIEPRGFDTLTVRQASMVVGALIEGSK